jgi:pSer/pThr/pTyr-binding forkhead associated (FHA) protein
VSKRHCAVLIRAEQAFVRDFNSTNGTAVNDQPVKDEVELHNDDKLTVGPLEFRVCLETTVPVDQSTPLPPTKEPAKSRPGSNGSAGAEPDEEAAALLLAMADEPAAAGEGDAAGTDEAVPTSATTMQVSTTPEDGAPDSEAKKKEMSRLEKAKAAAADTSIAASSILTKYLRRPRDLNG